MGFDGALIDSKKFNREVVLDSAVNEEMKSDHNTQILTLLLTNLLYNEINFIDELSLIIGKYAYVSRRNVGSTAYYSLEDVNINYDMNISTAGSFIVRDSDVPHFEQWNFYTGEDIVREYQRICQTDGFLGLPKQIQTIYTRLRDACLLSNKRIYWILLIL